MKKVRVCGLIGVKSGIFFLPSSPVIHRQNDSFHSLVVAHQRRVDHWIIVALTFMKQELDADI